MKRWSERLSARQIVIAYAACFVVSWLLTVFTETGSLRRAGLIGALVVGAALVYGLWRFWRLAWILALLQAALAALGVLVVAQPVDRLEQFAIRALQFALLLLPPLRSEIGRRG